MTKTCTKCGKEFPATREYFYKHSSGAQGLRSACKKCLLVQTKAWKARNPEKNKGSQRRGHAKHRLERNAACRRWYHAQDKATRVGRVIQWAKRNPDAVREKEKRRARRPARRVGNNISRSIRQSLAAVGERKAHRPWQDLVGFSLAELTAHLEALFDDRMSWENYGEWHIDHVVPVSWFGYESTEDEDFCRCWALENLQPMWADENMAKGNRWAGSYRGQRG